MIDSKDVLTVDAFAIKKRGRPATGNALTAAERKRNQRERDKASVWAPESEGGKDFKSVTVTALLENLAYSVSSGYVDTVQQISKELVRRAKLAAKN